MGKDIYGLVGYPLGHSFSHEYFNKKFAAENIDAQYLNFEIPRIDDFTALTEKYPQLRGLNVTIPYKQQVIPYLTELHPTAAEIGAVNVIKPLRDAHGRITGLRGYNSDVVGFTESFAKLLAEVLPQAVTDKGVDAEKVKKSAYGKALVLGTGGASKAVAYGLRQMGIEPRHVSRTAAPDVLTYAELHAHPQLMEEYKVIVNTTPLGMHPRVEAYADLPYEHITPAHICYDVVYNPEVTAFMRKCAERGAATKNGLEMLILQAQAAWRYWNT